MVGLEPTTPKPMVLPSTTFVKELEGIITNSPFDRSQRRVGANYCLPKLRLTTTAQQQQQIVHPDRRRAKPSQAPPSTLRTRSAADP